jgi:hypothetical protein
MKPTGSFMYRRKSMGEETWILKMQEQKRPRSHGLLLDATFVSLLLTNKECKANPSPLENC